MCEFQYIYRTSFHILVETSNDNIEKGVLENWANNLFDSNSNLDFSNS